MLRGGSVVVAGRLRLAGVDDPAGARTGDRHNTDEAAALSAEGPRLATILLKHRPDVSKAVLGRFDLQLSGHTHGGQIFPFWQFVRLFYPLRPGLHRLENGAALYVSRGAGTWGPPMRVLSPPEVTLITLKAPATTSHLHCEHAAEVDSNRGEDTGA